MKPIYVILAITLLAGCSSSSDQSGRSDEKNAASKTLSNQEANDFTGHSGWYPTTQVGGWVKIQVPPKSYSVWSPNI